MGVNKNTPSYIWRMKTGVRGVGRAVEEGGKLPCRGGRNE